MTHPVVLDDESPDEDTVVSLIEWHAMVRMPGGICLDNWLRLRGLGSDSEQLAMSEYELN